MQQKNYPRPGLLAVALSAFLFMSATPAQGQEKPKAQMPVAQDVTVLKPTNKIKPVSGVPRHTGLPDLIIKDMALSKMGGAAVLVANRGLAAAGPFDLLVQCIGSSTVTYTGMDFFAGLNFKTGLPKGGEKWVVLNLYPCTNDAISFRAVVDPYYSYKAQTILGMKKGTKEPAVDESNEDNNEMSGQKASLKPMPK